jgi:ATP/maltotriose-dependent transcriptional regulator MalT
MTTNRPPKLGEPLSHREMTVLKRLAYGRTNPEIGRDIHLAEDTVKTHVRRLFLKLGVTNRTEAVLTAMECGLIPCPCRKQVLGPLTEVRA